MTILRFARRVLFFSLGLATGLGLGGAATQAQPVPESGLTVPSTAMLGATITFKVRFANTAAAGTFGFGPFLDLALDFRGADNNAASLPCDGLDFLSARLVSVVGPPFALTGTTIKNQNTNTANCSAQSVAHPYAGVGTVTFPQGWQLVTVGLPFGSYDASQQDVEVEVTARIHEYADVGYPLAVCARGGFRYGASATGTTPILETGTTGNVSTWKCQEVRPEVFTLSKKYLGAEDETVSGPNFMRRYAIGVDIADQQTVGAPLSVTDCMPAGMAYGGGLTVTAAGWPAYVATEPALGATGGCLGVSWPTPAITGIPGPDATVEFNFYVADRNADGKDVLDERCKPALLDNPLAVSGLWHPKDPRDPDATVTGSKAVAHQLTAKCLAIQKSVRKVGGGTDYKPGDLLEYTLDFQVSDYKTIGQIRILDQLSNGQIFAPQTAPVLTIADRFGSYSQAIPSSQYTATADPSFMYKDCSLKGGTRLSFDVSGALTSFHPSHLRHIAGILTGGYALSPVSSIAARGKLVFYARIGDAFTGLPAPARYIDKDDPLCNAVSISGTLYGNNAAAAEVPPVLSGNVIAEDTSASVITISKNAPEKSIYAVRRGTGWACGPSTLPGPPPACAPGQQVFPGDQVTFRIQYVIPTGDAQSLVITDALPLPAFDVGATSWSFVGTPCGSGAIPAPGVVGCGPTHTAPVNTAATLFPLPTLATQPATNSVRLTYGTIFDTTNAPKRIDLLLTATVTNKPMADGLFLTNQAQECEQNTFGSTFCQRAIIQVEAREPRLSIRKGVIATDNPNGVFTPPAVAPAQASFSLAGVAGVVTSAGGPSPIGNLFDSDLSNVDANDLATFAIVIENQGGHPAFNVQLNDLIPWNGSTEKPSCFEYLLNTVRVRSGNGHALQATVTGSGPNISLALTGSIPALNAATRLSGDNIVIITFQVKMRSDVKAGCCDNKVELKRYTSTANVNSPNFVSDPIGDTARICVGPRAIAKCIQATSEAHTEPQQASPGATVRGAIGEVVRFRLVTTIPEGTTQNFQVRDLLPPGLTYIPGSARAVFVANSAVKNPVDISTVAAKSVQCPGTPTPTEKITDSPNSFPVGTGADASFPDAPMTITNTDNDPDLEYLVIEFNAQVDNILTNQDTTTLTNTFQARFTDGLTGQTVTSDSGPVLVAVVEPKLTLTKTASPTSFGPAGGSVSYTVTISNVGTATAFDLNFHDTLPAGSSPATIVSSLPGCGTATSGLTLDISCSSPAYAGLPPGGSLTITYKTTATPNACPLPMTNQAMVTWTSLPGPKGTLSNATGSATVGASGADNGERDGVTPSTQLNDYRAEVSATVDCVIPTADLRIGKLFEHPPVPGLSYTGTVTFKFSVVCDGVPVVPDPEIVPTLFGALPIVVPGLPQGAVCTVSETQPTTVYANGCYWAPPIPISPNPVTILPPPAENTVWFKNTFVCPVLSPAYDVSVSKVKLNTGSAGPNETYVITVQNSGSNTLSQSDLASPHLTVTDYLPPVGSVIVSYGTTDMTQWSCTPALASLPLTVDPANPVTCTYIGGNALALYAALPQLQIVAAPGTDPTQYVKPDGTPVTANGRLNCARISLSGTGASGHDDTSSANNLWCINLH